MGKIESNFEMYCCLLQQKVDNFTQHINIAEEDVFPLRDTVNPTSRPIISKTAKIHYLHHIVSDIRRFATATHIEAEKGEQFNKFIRNNILHTNRQNPSRDVLELFGRQVMFKHIIDGGSWMHGDERVRAASGIRQFLRVHPNFRQQYFGYGREYQDNNNSSQELKDGVTGFFREKANGKYCIGRITKVERPRNTQIVTVSLDLLDVLRGPQSATDDSIPQCT